jgi:hypothetical protein
MEIARWGVLGLSLSVGLITLATYVTWGIARARGVDFAQLDTDADRGFWITWGLIVLYVALGMLQGGTCGG